MKNSQNYILCIGGGKDVPYLLKKISENYKIVLVDQNINAPAKKYSNIFINCSYFDFKKIYNDLKKNKIHNLIKSIIFRSTGEITFKIQKLFKMLKIEYMPKKSAKILTYKNELVNFCNKNNILTPHTFRKIDNNIFQKYSTLLIKPALASGKRGIKIVKNNKNLYKAINLSKSLSANKKALIQSFVEGRDIGLIGQCIKNKFEKIFFMEEFMDLKKKRIYLNSIMAQPNIDLKQKLKCISIAKKICKTLKIKKSQINFQFKVSDKQIYLIEVHLNFPGDQILENLYSGFKKDILKYQLQNFIDNKNASYNFKFKNLKIYFYWNKLKKNRKKNFYLKKNVKYI